MIVGRSPEIAHLLHECCRGSLSLNSWSYLGLEESVMAWLPLWSGTNFMRPLSFRKTVWWLTCIKVSFKPLWAPTGAVGMWLSHTVPAQHALGIEVGLGLGFDFSFVHLCLYKWRILVKSLKYVGSFFFYVEDYWSWGKMSSENKNIRVKIYISEPHPKCFFL